jgi:hypothetical protein
MGRHEFRYAGSSWKTPHNIVYESCEFVQGLAAKDFVVYTNEGGSGEGNAGGLPLVVFRNCRSIGATQETAFFDSDQGFQDNNRAQLTKKLISIKGAGGTFPVKGGEESFRLPLGSVILNVKFLCRSGAVSSMASADYWIETSDASPVRVASVHAVQANQGFNVNQDTFFECSTEARSELKLRAGSGVDQPNAAAYCLLEYIG